MYLYIYIPTCAFQFVYMCGMFGSNFSHESGRNVDNYFHFRTVGYFHLQQNQKLVMVLYSNMYRKLNISFIRKHYRAKTVHY